jgi:hypothetical protein
MRRAFVPRGAVIAGNRQQILPCAALSQKGPVAPFMITPMGRSLIRLLLTKCMRARTFALVAVHAFLSTGRNNWIIMDRDERARPSGVRRWRAGPQSLAVTALGILRRLACPSELPSEPRLRWPQFRHHQKSPERLRKAEMAGFADRCALVSRGLALQVWGAKPRRLAGV